MPIVDRSRRSQLRVLMAVALVVVVTFMFISTLRQPWHAGGPSAATQVSLMDVRHAGPGSGLNGAPKNTQRPWKIPLHVGIWTYAGVSGGQSWYSPTPIEGPKWYNYVESIGTGSQNAAPASACPPDQSSCIPVYYFDTNVDYCASAHNHPGDTPEELWMHIPAAPTTRNNGLGHAGRCATGFREAQSDDGQSKNIWVQNQNNSSVQRYYYNEIQNAESYPAPNAALFDDDTVPTLAGLQSEGHFSSLTFNEIATDDALRRAQGAMINALCPDNGRCVPVYINCCGGGGGNGGWVGNPLAVDPLDALLKYATKNNNKGVLSEGIEGFNGAVAQSSFIRGENNASIIYAKSSYVRVIISQYDAPRGMSLAQARIQFLVDGWLMFKGRTNNDNGSCDSCRTVLWEGFRVTSDTKDTSNWPEELVYPDDTMAIQTMSCFNWGRGGCGNFASGTSDGSGCGTGASADEGGIKGLLVDGSCGSDPNGNPAGVYCREFAHVYDGARGHPVDLGRAMACRNGTDTPYDLQVSAKINGAAIHSYRHMLEVSGNESSVIGCGNCNGSIRTHDVVTFPYTIGPEGGVIFLE